MTLCSEPNMIWQVGIDCSAAFRLMTEYVPADIGTVIEGQLHVAGSRQLPYGGQDVNQHLRRMLQKRGVPEIENAALSQLKESCARLAVDGASNEV